MRRTSRSSFRSALLALAATAVAACGTTSSDGATSGAPSASALPPDAAVAPFDPEARGQPFTAHVAAERLRRRLVAQALAKTDVDERLSKALRAFAVLPPGHPSELTLLEGLDVTLRVPSSAASHELPPSIIEAAQRWWVRGAPDRARALLQAKRDLRDARSREERERLVEAWLVLDGREVARARGTAPGDLDADVPIARAEALHGDFAWAREIALKAEPEVGCHIWNALVVRHVRDARAEAASDAWAHARAAATPTRSPDAVRLDCLADFARSAASVGAPDEASKVLMQVPTARAWPACSVLEALSSDFDPLRLDVVVDAVAMRRHPLQESTPSCFFAASVAATRAGRTALGRRLYERGVARANGLGVYLADPRARLALAALGEVDPFLDGEVTRLRGEELAKLVAVLEERPDRLLNEDLFEDRFPAPDPR